MTNLWSAPMKISSIHEMKTRQVRRALSKAWGRPDPLPQGSRLHFLEGRATGHGRTPPGTPIYGMIVDVSGMDPESIEYRSEPGIPHAVGHGDLWTRCYWDGCAGGWVEAEIPDTETPE